MTRITTTDFGLKGFSEAGICTQNMDLWIRLFKEIGGWNETWRGTTSAAIRDLWGLTPGASSQECLLTCPLSDTGHVRLFSIQGHEQEEIRPDSNTWDTGGIFDLDLRVNNLLPLVEPLANYGVTGIGEPIDWQFDAFFVREWITRGPDSAVLALIQRLAPPLEGWDDLDGFSNVFNSSQIVTDIQASVAFYEKLGFEIILNHQGPLGGRGGEVLGISADQAPNTPVPLIILQVPGSTSGSIELVSFEHAGPEYQGLDLADRAKPYNLGLNLLRFPVGDLAGYFEHVQQAGIGVEDPGVVTASIYPYGDTELMALRTPDGVWLEFFQAN
jgi:catechol 2,3-dioxygenase-like lactoylglutathione lyase family enzyme